MILLTFLSWAGFFIFDLVSSFYGIYKSSLWSCFASFFGIWREFSTHFGYGVLLGIPFWNWKWTWCESYLAVVHKSMNSVCHREMFRDFRLFLAT